LSILKFVVMILSLLGCSIMIMPIVKVYSAWQNDTYTPKFVHFSMLSNLC
jgi:hypothetical protein